MKFETKTIHGVREGKKKELWGTNVNFSPTFLLFFKRLFKIFNQVINIFKSNCNSNQ